MTTSDEFKDLNVKMIAGKATADEQARWEELKQHLHETRRDENDSRAFPRASVPIQMAFASDEELTRAIVSDFGAGGICVVLEGSFEVDAEHQLELRLRPLDDKHRLGRGRRRTRSSRSC